MTKVEVLDALLNDHKVDESTLEGLDYNGLRSLLKKLDDERVEKSNEGTSAGDADKAAEGGEPATATEPTAGEGTEPAPAEGNNGQNSPSDDGSLGGSDEPEVTEDADPDEVEEITLFVYQNRVIGLIPGVKRVLVENLEGGDVYIDPISASMAKINKVTPGESKEFTGVDKLIATSASMPRIRVSQWK